MCVCLSFKDPKLAPEWVRALNSLGAQSCYKNLVVEEREDGKHSTEYTGQSPNVPVYRSKANSAKVKKFNFQKGLIKETLLETHPFLKELKQTC